MNEWMDDNVYGNVMWMNQMIIHERKNEWNREKYKVIKKRRTSQKMWKYWKNGNREERKSEKKKEWENKKLKQGKKNKSKNLKGMRNKRKRQKEWKSGKKSENVKKGRREFFLKKE